MSSYGEDEAAAGTWVEQVTPPPHAPGAAGGPPRTMRGRAAGWYPDPLDPARYQRWWTGAGWDTHTYPPGGPALPQTVHRQVRAPGPRLPWRAALAVVAALALAGTGAVAAHRLGGPAGRALPPASRPAPTAPTAPSGPTGPTVLALVGLPAGATSTCTGLAGAAAGSGPLTCTFHGPGAVGQLVCQAAGAGTTCTLTDQLTDRVSRTACAPAGTTLTCRPAGLDVPAP